MKNQDQQLFVHLTDLYRSIYGEKVSDGYEYEAWRNAHFKNLGFKFDVDYISNVVTAFLSDDLLDYGDMLTVDAALKVLGAEKKMTTDSEQITRINKVYKKLFDWNEIRKVVFGIYEMVKNDENRA